MSDRNELPPEDERALQGSGEKLTEPQAPALRIGDVMPPERQWELYLNPAVHALYPFLRDGVDYAIGSVDGAEASLLFQTELAVPMDWNAVVEEAKRRASLDPYIDYTPNPSLAPRPQWEAGEVRNKNYDDEPH